MLVSLNATFNLYWSTNCTNSVEGPSPNVDGICQNEPVFLQPWFDESLLTAPMTSPSYLGSVSSGGFTT